LIPSIPAVLGNFLPAHHDWREGSGLPQNQSPEVGTFTSSAAASSSTPSPPAASILAWTFYTPLSSVYSNSAVTPAVLAFHQRLLTILTA